VKHNPCCYIFSTKVNPIVHHSDKLGNFVCGFLQYIFLSIYMKELFNISAVTILADLGILYIPSFFKCTPLGLQNKNLTPTYLPFYI